MSGNKILFATDEDIALRAPADFSILSPLDQVVASGTDGVFESLDRWSLCSSQVDFEAIGVEVGQVVQLLKPLSVFRPQGTLMVVAAVEPGHVRLRRKGQPTGKGQPPAPTDGLTGVEFLVTTLGPQIELASEELGRRLGIDEAIQGRRPTDLLDVEPLREATVLTVLQRLYSSTGRDNRFSARAVTIQTELDQVLNGIRLRWKSSIEGSTTTRFGTKLIR